ASIPAGAGPSGRCATASPASGLLQQLRHERRPPGLVARPEPRARVAVKVLVEEQAVAPVGIGLKDVVRPEDRPAPARAAQEDAREPAGQLLADLPQRQRGPRARRALHE